MTWQHMINNHIYLELIMGLIRYFLISTAVMCGYTVYLRVNDPRQYQIHRKNMSQLSETIRKYWNGRSK